MYRRVANEMVKLMIQSREWYRELNGSRQRTTG